MFEWNQHQTGDSATAVQTDHNAVVGPELAFVSTAVDDVDRAGSVLSRRNISFESREGEFVVRDTYCKPALIDLCRKTLRERPAYKDASPF